MKTQIWALVALALAITVTGQSANIRDDAGVLVAPYRSLIEQAAWGIEQAYGITVHIYTTPQTNLALNAKQLRKQITEPEKSIQILINPESRTSYGYVGANIQDKLPRNVLDQMIQVTLNSHLEDKTTAIGVQELLIQIKGYLAGKPEIIRQYQPSAAEEAHTLYWTGLFVLILIIGNTLLTLIRTPKTRWTAKAVFSVMIIVASVFVSTIVAGGLLLLSAAFLVLDAYKAQQPQAVHTFTAGTGGFGTTGFGGYATHTSGFGNTSFMSKTVVHPVFQRHLTVTQKAHHLIAESFGQ